MAGAYRERVIDGELAEQLSAIGAVLIEGPKACGKTESAIQHAATTYRSDVDQAARNAASLAPDLVLDSPTPVLLDEWHRSVAPCPGHDDVGGRTPALRARRLVRRAAVVPTKSPRIQGATSSCQRTQSRLRRSEPLSVHN